MTEYFDQDQDQDLEDALILDDLEDKQATRLTTSQRLSARTLEAPTARYIVACYYQSQHHRIRAKQQLDSPTRGNAIVDRLLVEASKIERLYRTALKEYASGQVVGQWALSIRGIGPVLAGGLLANIDITKASHVGHVWRFAGLDPNRNQRPVKGEKRSYNAKLKTLTWKAGESFVKVSNRPDDFYGKLYKRRKDFEIANNEDLAYQELAYKRAEEVGKTTAAYKAYSVGKLPPAHIHARAKRFAVKIFLSHYFQVAYESHYGESPEAPYILAAGGMHTDFIAPPNWPLEQGA